MHNASAPTHESKQTEHHDYIILFIRPLVMENQVSRLSTVKRTHMNEQPYTISLESSLFCESFCIRHLFIFMM